MSSVLKAVLGKLALLTGLAAFLLFTSATTAGPASSRDDEVISIQLGDTVVQFVATERAPTGVRFVSLHENEQTAVAAARRIIERHGGRLLELKAQRQRLVSFRLAGTHYTFDPNRIFTDVGIEKSLRRYGPYSRAAHDAVARLGKRLIAEIRTNLSPPIIAVHNNSDGALSVESYRPGASLQGEAASIAINPKLDPDDFFLVTDRAMFDRLAARGFNVVLQSARPTDDGSMSVFCQRSGIPYVNVESEPAHSGEQYRMLEAIVAMGRGHRP